MIYDNGKRIFKKELVIFLVGFLLAGLRIGFAPMVQAAEVKEIKIGVVTPLSGPASSTGRRLMNVYELAFNEVNAAGGIKSMGGAKLKLLKGDSESKSDVGMTVTEKLINDGAVVIMGAYQSDVTYVSSQVAEKYKTPFVCEISVSPKIADRGFKYLFKISQEFPSDAKMSGKFFEYYGNKSGIKVRRVAFINEDTLFGKTNYEAYKNFLPKEYEQMVVFYQRGATDLTSELTKIKEWKPDVIQSCGYVMDAILIRRTMKEINLRPMLYIAGAAAQDPKYVEVLGELANYTATNGEWAPDIKKPGAAEVNERYKKIYGEDMFAHQGEAYAGVYVVKDVLERAASIDKEKIRKAFTETYITNHILPRKVVRFDQAGKDPDAISPMLQIISGKYYTIWPPEYSSKEGVWPGKY